MGLSESKDSSAYSDDSSSEMDSDILFDRFSLDSLSEDSSSEDELLSRLHLVNDGPAGEDVIDAAVSMADLTTKKQFTLADLGVIDGNLDLYEKISLVFLLENQSSTALETCLLLLKEQSREWLRFWALQNVDWQSKLLESLCLIQNYQILKDFGYTKDRLIQKFLPRYSFGNVYIDKIRKILYYICENLIDTKTQQLLTLVRNDFINNNLEFKEFPLEYLEIYLLHWETVGYIQANNLTNLYKIFKKMGDEEIYDKLHPFVVHNNNNNNNNTQIRKERKFSNNKTGDFIGSVSGNSSMGETSAMSSIESNYVRSQRPLTTTNNCYEIDENNPGICLIINQENFYREFDEKYKHLLPNTTVRFENRDGTQEDEEALKITFESFGFKVIIKKDLDHIEMIETIRKIVRDFDNESSLFVCILSHGDKGAVYGVNSCRTDVDDIQNILCSSKKLLGKPKVLILQSCQGNRLQKVIVEDDDLTTDGCSRIYNGPPTTDLFTFWATVPGYAAIRNKRTGSWFIQTLCNAMKQFGNQEHFEDICTEIIRGVSDKKWEKRTVSDDVANGEEEEVERLAMVPLKNSTFTKRLYLPPMKQS